MLTRLAFAFVLFAFACSGDDAKSSTGGTDSPATSNPTAKAAPPAYHFAFAAPPKAERSAQPGELIPIAFTLTVPPSTSPPSFTILHIMSGKTITDSRLLEPKPNSTAREQAFETTITAPKQPGTYTIRVDATRTKIYKGGKGKTSTEDVHVYSSPIKLLVKKGGK